jgi:hypothetical protein
MKIPETGTNDVVTAAIHDIAVKKAGEAVKIAFAGDAEWADAQRTKLAEIIGGIMNDTGQAPTEHGIGAMLKRASDAGVMIGDGSAEAMQKEAAGFWRGLVEKMPWLGKGVGETAQPAVEKGKEWLGKAKEWGQWGAGQIARPFQYIGEEASKGRALAQNPEYQKAKADAQQQAAEATKYLSQVSQMNPATHAGQLASALQTLLGVLTKENGLIQAQELMKQLEEQTLAQMGKGEPAGGAAKPAAGFAGTAPDTSDAPVETYLEKAQSSASNVVVRVAGFDRKKG